LAKHSSGTTAALTALITTTATIVATAAWASKKSAHALAYNRLLSIHDFLHERLKGIPFGVIGDFQLGFDAVHHHLLPLSGIHIAPLPTTAALASTLTAVAIILRQHAAGSQTH
jgi:hypothetical protein